MEFLYIKMFLLANNYAIFTLSKIRFTLFYKLKTRSRGFNLKSRE